MKRIFMGLFSLTSIFAVAIALPLSVSAATTVVVTPAHDDGWSTADTRPGGMVQTVYDPSSPMPDSALQLTTDGTNTAKAQYMHTANTALANVNTLSYQTKQIAASSTDGDASYQLVVCLGGVSNNNTCTGGTTLVYEPYWNGTVTSGTWQKWDVAAGKFWSSKTYTDATNSGCAVTAGSGGAPFYTLTELNSNCPDAQVVGFGVNIGTYNPSYVVEVDQIMFNDWTYDFQLTNVPTNKDQCKNSGYTTYTDQDGNAFKNQGDCVSFTNNGNSNNKHLSMKSVEVHGQNKSALYTQVKDQNDKGSMRANNQATQSNQTNQTTTQ